MAQGEKSANDPVFFVHHANVDRLWNLWLTLGGGRTDPVDNVAWRTAKFTFFDENAKALTMTPCDILRAQHQLGYVYEDEPPQVNLYCPKPLKAPVFLKQALLDIGVAPAFVLPQTGSSKRLEVDIRPALDRMRAAASDASRDLRLELVDISADAEPNVYYEVYAGLPRDADPQFNSPHYVGSVGFFGVGHGKHTGARLEPFFRFDDAVTALLRRAPDAAVLDLVFVRKAGDGAPIPERTTATITVPRIRIVTVTPK